MLVALLIAAAATASVPAPAPTSARADLVVVVEGVKGDAGWVRLDLCGPKAFLTDRCAFSGEARAQAGSVTVTLPDVPESEYAIQAWHDRDGDRRVSRNGLGIPTEALGFSRAPPLGLHGPSFARSSFAHGAAPQSVTVRLKGLL